MEILPPPAVKDADFRFRQFAVSQQLSAMKVGTDGVLLGAWAEAREGQILDIGTGTGLISLMLAQRTRQASVIGIDIDGWAVEEARMNAQRSPWKERLEMLHVGIEHYHPNGLFDEIVSNPPFYISSPSSRDGRRDNARCAGTELHETIIAFVSEFLMEDGVFEVVIPLTIADDFIWKCWEHNLYLYRRTDVCTRQGKSPKRSLLAFGKQKKPLDSSILCLMNAQGERTSEYRHLTEDFYL